MAVDNFGMLESNGRMNVLVIDDDCALLRSIEILLTGKGHKVVCFEDPEEACSFMRRYGQNVDVLVLDYMLPGITAESILLRAACYLPQTSRMIIISGHSDLIDPLDLAEMGAKLFLSKPLDFDRLCEAIEETEGRDAGD